MQYARIVTIVVDSMSGQARSSKNLDCDSSSSSTVGSKRLRLESVELLPSSSAQRSPSPEAILELPKEAQPLTPTEKGSDTSPASGSDSESGPPTVTEGPPSPVVSSPESEPGSSGKTKSRAKGEASAKVLPIGRLIQPTLRPPPPRPPVFNVLLPVGPIEEQQRLDLVRPN